MPISYCPPLQNKTRAVDDLSYQKLDILHALRGFCAFYVVIFHAKFILWSGGAEYLRVYPRSGWSVWQYGAFVADMLSSAGQEMVIFFFVLSGFFIRYAQLKKPRTVLRFYLNRVVRIYPPFLVSVVLSMGILAYIGLAQPALLSASANRELNTGLLHSWLEMHQLTLSALGRTLLFLKVKQHFLGFNEVYWSLLPEVLFYLIVPFAFRRVRYYYVISAVCFALEVAAEVAGFNTGYLGDLFLRYNSYFALGAGLCDVVVNKPGWLVFFRRSRVLGLVVGAGGLFVVVLATAAMHLRVVSNPAAALLAVLCISVLLAERVSPTNPLIRGLHAIGGFSFSLYLYHFPLLLFCYAGLAALTGSLVNYSRYYWLALPVVTAGCFALYYVTERIAVRFFRGT